MMISAIGNKNEGFTLIEVLLSVTILAVGLAGVLGAYREVLGSYQRARLAIEGRNVLQEKMADQELEIRGGYLSAGFVQGKEGIWNWSAEAKAAAQEGWYEIKGEVKGAEKTGTITVYQYVRP